MAGELSMLVLILLYGEKDLKRGRYNVSNQKLILLEHYAGTQVPRADYTSQILRS